jgi:hypothetical protein
VIALLAGIAGLISRVLLHGPLQSGLNFFINLAIFAVPVLVAVIALVQINRLEIIGFLQGMWWLAVPFLAATIVLVAHLSNIPTDRAHAEVILSFTAYALGVIAAGLLMVSWSRAANRRRAPWNGMLSLMLLGTIGSSQIAALFLYVNEGQEAGSYYSQYYYILGSVEVFVGLAITWYAMCLRARALGGALILGWVTIAVLTLMTDVTKWSLLTGVERFWVVLEYVLLATVVALTIFYVREPSGQDSSGN